MATRKKKKDNGRGGKRPGAGRKAPAGKREYLGIRLNPKLRQRLAAKAKAEKCSLTELVERLLKTALEDASDAQ
jgi:predicted HicB family RNase H-like nuclease